MLNRTVRIEYYFVFICRQYIIIRFKKMLSQFASHLFCRTCSPQQKQLRPYVGIILYVRVPLKMLKIKRARDAFLSIANNWVINYLFIFFRDKGTKIVVNFNSIKCDCLVVIAHCQTEAEQSECAVCTHK